MPESLFPSEFQAPEGFSYYPEFISPAEEENLLAFLREITLHPMVFQGYEPKRLVASFGFDYSFEEGRLKKGKEIPQQFRNLIEKVAAKTKINASDFVELLVTEYPPGSVINWHRDAPPFGIIAGISLASDCKFRFRPHRKEHQSRKSIITQNVARRSLYVLAGDSRSEWQHSIAPVKQRRFSITLRTLK